MNHLPQGLHFKRTFGKFARFIVTVYLFFFGFSIIFISKAISQKADTISFFSRSPILNLDRVRGLAFAETSVFSSGLLGINELWYRSYPREKFHFFNDNSEWLQMDKASHFFDSYYIGKLGIDALKWAGTSKKNSVLWGAGFGFLFLSTVEFFDGYSVGWGYSKGDALSNCAGTAFLLGQEYLWGQQKILLKYTFSRTKFPSYNPDLLGKNFQQQLVKDYNGMTFWMSTNPSWLFRNKNNRINKFFPDWLNIAAGYGADGMIGGNENPKKNSIGNPVPSFQRKRQYYLSLDVDLTRLKTKSKFLHSFFYLINFFKIPAPAIELEGKKIKFHPIYF